MSTESAPLFILVGAGASGFCAWDKIVDKDQRPPLTGELFDDRFAPLLNHYPLANAAASPLKDKLAAAGHVTDQPGKSTEDDAVTLEDVLRDEFIRSENPTRRAQGVQLRLYFQHVLWHVGRPGAFMSSPDSHDRLLHPLVGERPLTVVSLNYDTILDDALFGRSRGRERKDVDSYLDPGTGDWSLIKVHGSVDWAYPLDVSASGQYRVLENYLAALQQFGGDLPTRTRPVLRSAQDLRAVRADGDYTSILYYPALALPLGPDDEVICPDAHVGHLRERLDAAGVVNLLVIGYSGIDKRVLELLRMGNGRQLGSAVVVNGSREHGETARGRLVAGLGCPRERIKVFDGGFPKFVERGPKSEFTRFLDGLE